MGSHGNRVCRCGKSLLVTAGNDHVGIAFGKAARQAQTDPSTSPRDKDRLVGDRKQLIRHGGLPVE